MRLASKISRKPWPSREEWAKTQQTYYWDDYIPVSNRVRDYASDDELAAAVEELRSRIKLLDAQVREAKKVVGHLVQQKGETKMAYCRRWMAMTEEEQDKQASWDRPRDHARDLRGVLRALADGDLPRSSGDGLKAEVFGERYQQAVREYHDEQRRIYAERPIDDEAWERELQRRREWDGKQDRL